VKWLLFSGINSRGGFVRGAWRDGVGGNFVIQSDTDYAVAMVEKGFSAALLVGA